MRFERFALLSCAAFAALSLETLTLPVLADPEVTSAPVPGGAQVTPAGAEVKVQIESMVAEGPLYEERGLLLKRINAAKAQGIGIAGYLSAFKYVEEMTKSNAPPEKIKERIAAVNKGLDDQSKRAVDLKNRPAATAYDGGTNSTGGGGGEERPNPAASDIASQLKGNPDGLLDKLKAKFGDKIPEGTDIESLKRKFMGDERAKDILKKLGN